VLLDGFFFVEVDVEVVLVEVGLLVLAFLVGFSPVAGTLI